MLKKRSKRAQNVVFEEEVQQKETKAEDVSRVRTKEENYFMAKNGDFMK